MAEVKSKDIKVSKPLRRFTLLLNCERVIQVVQSKDIYRQVRINLRIYHLVLADVFLPGCRE